MLLQQCPTCGRRFTVNSNYKRHRDTVDCAAIMERKRKKEVKEVGACAASMTCMCAARLRVCSGLPSPVRCLRSTLDSRTLFCSTLRLPKRLGVLQKKPPKLQRNAPPVAPPSGPAGRNADTMHKIFFERSWGAPASALPDEAERAFAHIHQLPNASTTLSLAL